jgi:hypothetical protein
MPRRDYKTCRNCGRHADEAGLLSRTRLCTDCSHTLMDENNIGIATHTGLAEARWRLGTVAAALRHPALVNALIDAGAFSYSSATTDSKGSR